MKYTRSTSAMAKRMAITVLATVALGACGGDDDPAGPTNTDVVGDWAFQVTGTDNSGASCNVTGLTLTFTRTGDTLSGTMSGDPAGIIACTPGGSGPFTGTTDLETVEQNGGNVEFTYVAASGLWTMLGTMSSSGNAMNGTVTFPVNFTSGVSQFTGTWSATRN